jgi:hypothetical protein
VAIDDESAMQLSKSTKVTAIYVYILAQKYLLRVMMCWFYVSLRCTIMPKYDILQQGSIKTRLLFVEGRSIVDIKIICCWLRTRHSRLSTCCSFCSRMYVHS